MSVSPSPNDLTRQQLDELDTLLQRMLALPVSQPEPTVTFPPPPPLPDLPPVTPRSAPRPAEPSTATWRADPPEPVAGSPRTPAAKAPLRTPAPEPAVAFTPSVLPFPAPSRPSPEPPRAEPPTPRGFAPTPSVPFAPDPPMPVVAPGTLRGVDAPALPYDFVPAAPAAPPPTPEVEFAEVNPFADPPPPAVPPAPEPSAARVPVPLWPLFALNWVLEFALGWFGPVGALLVRPAMKTLLGFVGVLLLIGAGVWAARGMGWVSWPR